MAPIFSQDDPIKINILGKVLDKNVSGLKGAKLTIEDLNGEVVEKGKSGKNGEFKFKKVKILPGEYSLNGIHKKKWKWQDRNPL